MRAVPCLALALVIATPVLAQGRYGPETIGNRAGSSSVTPAVTAPGLSHLYRSAPLADGALRHTSALAANTPPAPPPVVDAPVSVAPAAPAENAPRRRLTGIVPAARPTTPVQAEAPLPAAAPALASSSQAEYRTDTAARSTPAAAGAQAHFYSLHREYGETPDPIVLPERSQVFLAGAPLGPRLDEQDDVSSLDDTGRTAAARKARIAADWSGAANDAPAAQRVQIIRP